MKSGGGPAGIVVVEVHPSRGDPRGMQTVVCTGLGLSSVFVHQRQNRHNKEGSEYTILITVKLVRLSFICLTVSRN